jgi:hypothetical protein
MLDQVDQHIKGSRLNHPGGIADKDTKIATINPNVTEKIGVWAVLPGFHKEIIASSSFLHYR